LGNELGSNHLQQLYYIWAEYQGKGKGKGKFHPRTGHEGAQSL
jgi:hypothetical protein